MLQTQQNKIKRIVRENKAYLEALEELDRTGRLRKVSYKERINFTIDEVVLNEFRKYCESNGYKMSSVVEQLIRGVIEKRS